MTGVLQTHARKTDIPIDRLSFKFKVMNPNRDAIMHAPAVKKKQIESNLLGWCLYLWPLPRRW